MTTVGRLHSLLREIHEGSERLIRQRLLRIELAFCAIHLRNDGSHRLTKIHRAIPDVSQRMLTLALIGARWPAHAQSDAEHPASGGL
jgi:hypothetical protein